MQGIAVEHAPFDAPPDVAAAIPAPSGARSSPNPCSVLGPRAGASKSQPAAPPAPRNPTLCATIPRMFRRPRPSPTPPPPLGLDDLEEQPRAPLISRHSVRWAVGIFAAGIAWGAAVAFADSLPIDLGFIAFVLKVVVGFVFVIGLVLRLLFRGFEVDRVALVALLALGGATVGLNIGPTIVPAATVTGTYTFAPSVPAGTVTTAGALECEWANGRWKIGALRTITPVEGLPTPHQLTIDFLRKTMSLSDEKGSNLVAVGNGAFVSPADAPPRGEGDRSGTLDLFLLQVGIESTPDDPNEVRARFSWECPGPPPA